MGQEECNSKRWSTHGYLRGYDNVFHRTSSVDPLYYLYPLQTNVTHALKQMCENISSPEGFNCTDHILEGIIAGFLSP